MIGPKKLSTIREDEWRTFNTKSLLGGASLGQKKYAEAKPLLLAGYAGMKQRLHSPHRGEDPGDLVGPHGAIVIDEIGADAENDLRAIGEVVGRGHFDSSIVDHCANGAHG